MSSVYNVRCENNISFDLLSKFINDHDKIGANITEITRENFNRILLSPCIIITAYNNNNLVGCVISLFFRVSDSCDTYYTCYSTFLCVHQQHRKNQLASLLIQELVSEAFKQYNCNQGYYLCAIPRSKINFPIKAWYRPINLQITRQAGFTLVNKWNTKNLSARQKLFYHISPPGLLPMRLTEEDYPISFTGKIQLNPTQEEYNNLLKSFDIFILDGTIFFLFPITSMICERKKRVRTCRLAYWCGNADTALSGALWIAKELQYDLLYGWTINGLTKDLLTDHKALITIDTTYLEFYDKGVDIKDFNLPIF